MTTAPVPPTPGRTAAVTAPGIRCAIPEPEAGRPDWRAFVPGTAGIAYLAAWAVGLSVWPVNLALNASAAQVAASHRAHPAEAASQYLLVEGLAGVLFGVVLACAVLSGGRARMSEPGLSALAPGALAPGALAPGALASGALAPGAAALAAIALVTSLTQCVLGLLATAAATSNDAARCGDLFALVNRLDGVKMIALAAATALIALITRPAPVLPRWLRAATVPLGLALIASGYAYLTLSSGLAWTAFVSGPLLLLWVTGTGIALTARTRR
jgi:hypothetical protein